MDDEGIKALPKKMKKVLNIFHTPYWLFFILIGTLLLRIPSLFEPYSYGDEMIYLSLGEAIRQGIPLYKGIHDNKPPFLYILAAIAGNLFWFKVILALWSMVTIFVFWKLVEHLFPKNSKLQKISTFIFAILTTIPLLEGNIVNSELFMIGPTILAFLILLRKNQKPQNIFLAGTLFSFASLFKMPAAFDMPAILVYWLITSKFNWENIKRIGLNTLILVLGFITPILITFIWFFVNGALKEYLVAAFLQNVGYLSSWRPSDAQKPFLVRNTPLLLRTLVVVIGIIILYLKRLKLSKQFILITVWLMFSLFAVTLSERPYPHYLIQAIAPISVLLAMFFSLENIEQTLVTFPLFLAFFVPFYYKFWYYPTSPYYLRFVNFATGKMSRNDYLDSFGGNIQRNYKLAEYIINSTSKKQKVFIWGDASVIYALSKRLPPGKYVADYHIRDFSSINAVLSDLQKDKPKLIIVLPQSNTPKELYYYLRSNFILLEEIDDAEIWISSEINPSGISI